jgi:hypothetical protein
MAEHKPMLFELWAKLRRNRAAKKPEKPLEDRAIRLGRVVRLLRQEGWMVTVWSDGFLRIWDARYPPNSRGTHS